MCPTYQIFVPEMYLYIVSNGAVGKVTQTCDNY